VKAKVLPDAAVVGMCVPAPYGGRRGRRKGTRNAVFYTRYAIIMHAVIGL